MFQKIIIAAVFSLIATGASAVSSKYNSTLPDNSGPIANVTISLSEEVASETKMYDSRDTAYLQDVLYKKVVGQLTRNHLMQDEGSTLELVITGLKPNRPTMAQYRDKPGLHSSSIALGGAKVTGKLIARDGTVIGTLDHVWEEVYIDNLVGVATWSDAWHSFDRLSRRIAEDVAAKPAS
ncbi:MAG: hypothetical protein COA47_15090 [Robiginitomaculum sp.]|nr:MAG: hypothetical protein COA47_15090 [Robiginitomaculum sp.]